MGFKDAEWAYGLELPMASKVVLVAVCHRTDDKKHHTFVGQQTIAQMTGASPKTVQRSLRDLELAGIITRTHRHGRNGFRTSDLIEVNTAYRSESPIGTQPTRQTAHKAHSPDLVDSQSPPTGHSDRAMITQRSSSRSTREGARPLRGTRLPDGWLPSEALRAQMQLEHPTVDQRAEYAKFVDHWSSAPGSKGVKADWDATWRNWIRRAAEYDTRRPSPSVRAQQTVAAGVSLIQKRTGIAGNITTLTPRREIS